MRQTRSGVSTWNVLNGHAGRAKPIQPIQTHDLTLIVQEGGATYVQKKLSRLDLSCANLEVSYIFSVTPYHLGSLTHPPTGMLEKFIFSIIEGFFGQRARKTFKEIWFSKFRKVCTLVRKQFSSHCIIQSVPGVVNFINY